MKKSQGKCWNAGLVGALIALASGCGGSSPAAESAATDPSALGSGEDAAREQDEPAGDAPVPTVGQVTDGAVLSALEVSGIERGALLRLVFDGQGAPPITQVSRTPDGQRLVIEIYGVREVRAEIPLVTGEGGTVLGAPRALGEGPLVDVGRYFLGDDSGVRLELALREQVELELKEGSEGRSVEVLVKSRN